MCSRSTTAQLTTWSTSTGRIPRTAAAAPTSRASTASPRCRCDSAAVHPDPKETMRRAAMYVRVSTDRQTAENQLEDVRRLAVARGYEPVVYEEVESAAKARPVLDGMLSDVRLGRVDAVA